MSVPDGGEANFSLKVMMNEKKTKVLFAEANSEFVDTLLSFLTLPLVRIIKILERKYGDEAPTIGSLSTLYNSLVNLDSSHFWTEGAKNTLLNPISTFDADCESLKLDITDSPPAEYFYCSKCSHHRYRIVSVYRDTATYCRFCVSYHTMIKEVVEKRSESASGDGVFIKSKASFIISDDLQIWPIETGLFQLIGILGITDTDNTEAIKMEFGLSEVMYLLKASLTSPTPLSDLILNQTGRMNSTVVESQQITAEEENRSPGNLTLKVIIQKSTGKLLYAEANEKFMEFLFSLLIIPLGGVEQLMEGKTCFKAIDNLHRSISEFIGVDYFKDTYMNDRLRKPKIAHGLISKDHILPLTEERFGLDHLYSSSVKFPRGHGHYLQGLQTYKVSDDLTAVPYCFTSILSSLREQRIAISDVEGVELQIGLKEGLSILKASLTSTSALTDALQTQISKKRVKIEI